MKNTYKYIIGIIIICICIYGYEQIIVKPREQKLQAQIKKDKIKNDSLVKVSDGYYTKLVADTLTKKQLRELATEITELKNRQPISVTRTIIQPVRIEKETDNISVEEDSVFIEDFYPAKENPFLRYTNRFSLTDKKGISEFDFNQITLQEVVTKKEDGLYQVDFKGPDFLEVKSLDIQTEPQQPQKKDDFGILVGLDYEKNFGTNRMALDPNVYLRFKKFYLGGGISTSGDGKLGIKIEL